MTAVLPYCLSEQHSVIQSMPVPLSKAYQENAFTLLTCLLSCRIRREEMFLSSVSWTQTGCSKTNQLGLLNGTACGGGLYFL